MNVLITSASNKVSLVKFFKNALAAEGSGRVIAIEANLYGNFFKLRLNYDDDKL